MGVSCRYTRTGQLYAQNCMAQQILRVRADIARARGEIFIHPETDGPFALHTEGILELWIDNVHYFGGDFYQYGRAPVTLRLSPGLHRIDIRLVRDIRAFGAVGAPTVDVKLRLERSKGELEVLHGYGKNILMSEAVGGTFGPLASPFASITMRNDAETDVYVHRIDGMGDRCVIENLARAPVKLVPGQTRPITLESLAFLPTTGICICRSGIRLMESMGCEHTA